ncbi:MAG: beta-N-acetylhexosaminidase [Asticcacaulis sp.]
MKTAIFTASAFCLALGALALPAAAQIPPQSQTPVPPITDVAQWVTPALHEWKPQTGDFSLVSGARIVLPKSADAYLAGNAELLSQDIASVGGPVLKVVKGEPARPGDILFDLGDPGVGSASPEAYSLDIAKNVTIRAKGRSGLFYGSQSLVQLLKHGAGRTLPHGHAADWPNYGNRTFMIDVGRRYFEINQLDNTMREMAWLKLNTLHLHFTDWPAFRLNSPKYPGLAAQQSYDKADIAHLEATAKRYNITIIPEIDLPAHAVALTDYKPSLGFTCESMRRSDWLDRAAGDRAKGKAWAIDITRNENREWLDGLLDEFIPWFNGPYFHIGGDEYQYDPEKVKCPELMQAVKDRGLQYPGDVFVDWINETNKVVKAHGKTTVIWNWWRFKADQTSIQPSKDIIIEAWNSPRLKNILADGYKVLITPEDKLYVVPGIENFDGSGYGVVDSAGIYENFPMETGPQVMGYALALWTDAAEGRTDAFLLGKAYEPMAVLAERMWSDKRSPDLATFLARLNKTSVAPRQPKP